jgi:hypothetical protein
MVLKNVIMKKSIYLLLIVALMGLANCTTETEEYSSVDKQLQDRKNLIIEMAKDYGLENFKVDENKIRANLHMPIEDIEKEMRALSMLKGTYCLVSDGNGNFSIGDKITSPRRRASGVEPEPNEIVKANITYHNQLGDSVRINWSFRVEFGTIYGNVQCFNPTFTAVVITKNDITGNYDVQTFTGVPTITLGQPNGYYPFYSIDVTVNFTSESGEFCYDISTVVDFENGKGGANLNSINYAVIQ